MKILKIALVSLLVLVALVVIAAVVLINVIDVNKFKPQIVEQANKALGRQVDFQRARLGIGFNGIGLKIDGLTIAEDPAFAKGEFLSVKQISVGVDILGYLLRRQISLTTILIDAPTVTVIRGRDGAINAQTIGKGQEQGAPSAAPAAIPALMVSSIKSHNGTVKYIDRSFDPPVMVEARDIDFSVHGLSLSDPFSFAVQASVLGRQQNVKVEGRCQLDLKNLGVRVFDLKASSDLSRLALAQVPHAFPMVPAQALPSELKGTVELTVPELRAGIAGLTRVNGVAVLRDGVMRYKEMAVPVRDITADIKITEKDILADSFSAAVGQGGIQGTGWLKNYLSGQDFNFELGADKLAVADLVDQSQMPIKAEGLVAFKGQVKGHGFAPEALRSNLVGQACADITGAKLKNLNVMRLVLDQMAVIPGLGESIETGLPETYTQKLRQKDTMFSDFKVPLTIVNGRIIINDTQVSSEGLFTFKTKGEAGFDGTYSLEGAFLMDRELSRSLVASVGQMQYLLNEDQMIFIPLRVSGAAGARIQFAVDAGYITRKLLENQARRQIMKGLDKIFGDQGAGQQEAQPAPQGQDTGQGDAEKKVNQLLDKLFK